MSLDLRNATFAEFVAAVFDHPANEQAPSNLAWYWDGDDELQTDSAPIVEYLTRVFEAPRELLIDFSLAQIEQGLWFISSVESEHFIGHLWNAAVPFEARTRCIAAVYSLYDQLLAVDDFETIDYMLTDFLAQHYEYRVRHESEAQTPDAQRVRGAFLDVFGQLLDHPSYTARYAALHGLGHLNDPIGAARIERFLRDAPYVDERIRLYAQDAIEGTVL